MNTTLSPFLQELRDSGTLTFRTRPEDKQQHGVEAEIAVSWPPPRWLYDASKLCSADARVSWNTRGIVNGDSEPVTLTITGQGEVVVSYHEPLKQDIWSTASMVMLDHWRVEPVSVG